MVYVKTVKDHVICVAEHSSVCMWHYRLGHMSESRMKTLSHLGYVLGFSFSNMYVCEYCLYGKQTMSPHKRVSSRKLEPLQLVHSDVRGPMPIVSMCGAQYFITFIDDFSQKVWFYSFYYFICHTC